MAPRALAQHLPVEAPAFLRIHHVPGLLGERVEPHREGVETLDCIEITGEPHLRLSVTPEIPGGIATAALAVNVIPRVLAAAPGLCSMIDIPPPAAMAGPRIRNRRDTARYGASGCGTGR